jgi:hypothetical protein
MISASSISSRSAKGMLSGGSGQQVERQQHQNHEQPEPQHAARQRGQQNVERGGGEQVQRIASSLTETPAP